MGNVSRAALAAFVLILVLPVMTFAAELVPGGQVIGLQVKSDSVTVVAYDETFGHTARAAGIRIGDEILAIDGQAVDSPQSVREAIQEGESVTVTIRRGGKLSDLELAPIATEDGTRLGVYLRQGIAGIGTVTFYAPQTQIFGTLGHGVCDSKGKLLPMKEGVAFPATVSAVKKGISGQPGQLKGSAAGAAFAQLTKNTPQGLFGLSSQPFLGQPISTADFAEIQTGPATIRSTVDDSGVQEYSVELLKIYPEDRTDGRNFLIKVTDEALLQKTGGIVQGMSGSPILQNGKIIGAVTHVLVNDPTMGYGIYIGNMLDAAA